MNAIADNFMQTEIKVACGKCGNSVYKDEVRPLDVGSSQTVRRCLSCFHEAVVATNTWTTSCTAGTVMSIPEQPKEAVF
jgi:hypothetical protein